MSSYALLALSAQVLRGRTFTDVELLWGGAKWRQPGRLWRMRNCQDSAWYEPRDPCCPEHAQVHASGRVPAPITGMKDIIIQLGGMIMEEVSTMQDAKEGRR